jgi:hypothetical protein
VEIQGEREKEPERLGDALAGRESSALNPSQKRAHLEVDVARGVEQHLRLFDPAGEDTPVRRP